MPRKHQVMSASYTIGKIRRGVEKSTRKLARKNPNLNFHIHLVKINISTAVASKTNSRGHGERMLYKILEERLDSENINISHTILPAWEQHQKFICDFVRGEKDHPYKYWYLIMTHHTMAGHCYISKQNEIGVFILKKHQQKGLGKSAIQALMARHPEGYYLANINPKNTVSEKIFSGLGFKKIQHTYKITIAEAASIVDGGAIEWRMLD